MKKYLKIFLVSLIALSCLSNSFAQNTTDDRLADQYFNNKEYGKAVIYYEKLFNRSDLPVHYLRLLNCFLNLEEYKNAEKLTKRQVKKKPFRLDFLVDLGNVYEVSGASLKAGQSYDKALKLLSPDNTQIMSLANAFLKYKKTDYTIKTYQKGRKLLKGSYPFNFELAQVYSQIGETDQMFNEYLNLLEYQSSYIQSIQNALQTSLNPDEGGKNKALLKTLLIKRIQKSGDTKIYPEMLIWLYIQDKNFTGAFIQAKAMDKRYKETGKRIDQLAKLSAANKDYENAIACYEYLILKGDESYYYLTSKMELVEVYNTKIITSGNYTQEDLVNLESNYNSTINELGRNASTSSLLRGLAHLQAFYLHNTDDAIILLNEILKIPRLKPHDAAKAKLELADIYVFTDDIWEASLLYSQVEKAYKYDQLGEQAKFKNAKISFYTGDFGWAKTQLNVLKASTSKLIANDAMQLSILITDNIGIDTTEAPLLMFAKADLLAFQNKNEEAMLMLDMLKKEYPAHTIMDDILYKRFQINYKQQMFEAAANNLIEIVDNYSFDILADDAIYNLALLNDYQFNKKEKASYYYKKLLFDFQSSVYVVDSRKRYREINNEVKILDIDEDNLTIGTFNGSGKHTIYNQNKQISKEGFFENYRLMDGKWYRYDDDGKLIKIELYKKGEYLKDEDLKN